MDKELTPKQQTSEALRQAETILVMTGQRPNIDQVASTIALTAILRKFGKKVTAVISDDIPAGTRFLPTQDIERQMGGLRDFIIEVGLTRAEVDKLKYEIADGKLNIHVTPFSGGFQPKDVSFSYGDYQFDAIIVLGVASYSRLDKIYVQNADVLRSIPLINIDYHRSNEQYGAINLVESSAASLAEILIALSESLQGGLIDDDIATTMLTGIMAATDRFTATHTTAKTMTVAAQMLAMGANQQKIVKNLYRSEKADKSGDRQKGGQPPAQQQPAQLKREKQPEKRAIEPVASVPQPQPKPVVTEPVAQAVLDAPAYQPPFDVAAPVTNPVASQPSDTSATAPVEQSQSVEPKTAEPRNPQPPAASGGSTINLGDTMPIPPAPAESSANLPIPQPETPEPASVGAEPSAGGNLDSLLPPQQLEPAEPEPLINDTTPVKPVNQQPARASNPINNPVFAQRLDELDY